jgi:hypothetical protein
LTASHVVAPWRFPKYYPDEWLQFVNEKHTHYTVELRHDDGVFMTQTELIPTSIHHATRDLAVLHLETASSADELFNALGLDVATLHAAEPQHGEKLEFHGHEVCIPSSFGGNSSSGSGFNSSNGSDAGDRPDDRHPVPRVVRGTYHGQTVHQMFVKTHPVLTYGMCGGPVMTLDDNARSESACGLLEGIIPLEHQSPELRGLASIVDSRKIADFLVDVEAGPEQLSTRGHVTLIGGEAAHHVGSDQDPEKTFENLLKKIDS